jgi:hypothetical protein
MIADMTQTIELINRATARIEDYANKIFPASAGSGASRDYYAFSIESADERGITYRCEYNGSCYCHPESDYAYITLPWEEILKDEI